MPAWSDRIKEWKKEVKKVCPKPKLGQIIVVWDNIYEYMPMDTIKKFPVRYKWKRLSVKESMQLYMHQNHKELSPTGWLQSISNENKPNRKSCDD